MQILKCGDLIDIPWKNGGGTTRNIAQGLHADHAAWRISRADVDRDGAFSDFAGLIRVLTVVSGAGMSLDHPEGTLAAPLWRPVRFDGALKIQSRLTDGPLTDLNLMFDPTLCQGEVITRQGPLTHRAPCPAAGLFAFHVLAGAPVINGARLAVGDTAFCTDTDTDAALTLSRGDAVLDIALTYLDQSDSIKLAIAAR